VFEFPTPGIWLPDRRIQRGCLHPKELNYPCCKTTVPCDECGFPDEITAEFPGGWANGIWLYNCTDCAAVSSDLYTLTWYPEDNDSCGWEYLLEIEDDPLCDDVDSSITVWVYFEDSVGFVVQKDFPHPFGGSHVDWTPWVMWCKVNRWANTLGWARSDFKKTDIEDPCNDLNGEVEVPLDANYSGGTYPVCDPTGMGTPAKVTF
jgi:hypothetical protein